MDKTTNELLRSQKIGIDMERLDEIIKYPTPNHAQYLHYASAFCRTYKIPLILKGSLSKGNATPFSDIDIIIGMKDDFTVDECIKGYKSIAMSNYTEKPKGILSIVYCDTICVDIDVRQKITKNELEKGVVIAPYLLDTYIGDELVRVTDFSISSIPKRDETYKTLRLFHRSLIKKLCGKNQNALDILKEIYDELNLNAIFDKSNYKVLIQKALNYIKGGYLIPAELDSILQNYINIVQ